MGRFVFVQYDGMDAGEVILRVLGGDMETEEEEHEHVPKRIIGFQPNPEVEEVESITEIAPHPNEEPLEDEDDDGQEEAEED